MSHGKSYGRPAISVYNLVGELLNYYIYTKDSLASAINKSSLTLSRIFTTITLKMNRAACIKEI